MLIETIIISIIVGLIAKGKIVNIGQIRFQWAFLIFLALAVRNIPLIFKISFFSEYENLIPQIAPLFFLFSYSLIILAIISNLKYKSMYFILAGTVLNFLVVAANGGYMPVLKSGLIAGGYNLEQVGSKFLDMNHIISSSHTRLIFLADIILVPPPYPFPQMISIGDILMNIGLFIFVVNAMRSKT